MTPALLAAIMDHVRGAPGEACGLLVWDSHTHAQYRPCRNTMSEPDRFAIHRHDWAAAEDAGAILGVVHSHPSGDLTPSPWDLRSCAETRLPWWIVNAGGDWVRVSGKTPLMGRPYAWGVSDCLTIIRDWYESDGWALPDLLRDEHGPDYPEHLHLGRFRLVSEAPERGDLLLFPRRHAGVYLGHGRFMHHREGQLSRVDLVDGYWRANMQVARCAR